MALNIPPLPRPAYLQGVTITNTDDYKTKSALHVFEHGRLSTVPCELCVEDDADCIVSKTRASRCMRCVYLDTRAVECQAEGVRNPVTKPNAPSTPQPAFPVEANSPKAKPANPQNKSSPGAAHPKQKRKRRVSDPADAVEIAAKRLRGSVPRAVTDNTYARIAPRLTDQASATTPEYAPVMEHPYAPTAPGATAHGSDPVSVARTTLATHKLSTVRFAPSGSREYDLAIRTANRVAWAQWAIDLYKELRALRHVQDLGPYTMGVIAMMTEDGVWPTGNEIDLEEE